MDEATYLGAQLKQEIPSFQTGVNTLRNEIKELNRTVGSLGTEINKLEKETKNINNSVNEISKAIDAPNKIKLQSHPFLLFLAIFLILLVFTLWQDVILTTLHRFVKSDERKNILLMTIAAVIVTIFAWIIITFGDIGIISLEEGVGEG